MLQKVIWLSAAGACGTLARYVVCEIAARMRGGPFPLGTFTVNVLGSFLFGCAYSLAGRQLGLSSEARVVVLTGLIGGFTTFSAFAFETAKMLNSGQLLLALANVVAQVALGVIALAAGVVIGRLA